MKISSSFTSSCYESFSLFFFLFSSEQTSLSLYTYHTWGGRSSGVFAACMRRAEEERRNKRKKKKKKERKLFTNRQHDLLSDRGPPDIGRRYYRRLLRDME